ncbi:MAG: MBL fold metallo-hydrolase [Patescibacteria group bacterium]|nr:MBL fold metallo-hydrolase [Patescibacteria group bacterium]
MAVKMTFLGATEMVTGSNYLIESEKTKLLVDCGFFQGNREISKKNYDNFAYDPRKIDFVILTHAHLDHCGRLPKLYKDGFRGPVYCTPATAELTTEILTDAAQIQEHGASDREIEILFNTEHAKGIVRLFKPVEYGHEIKPSKDTTVRLKDAGHILGSSLVELWVEDKKIVFSGDLGNSPVPILRDPEIIEEADYVICESTYGNRLHEPVEHRSTKLLEAAKYAAKHNAPLLVPSFALERTQDLLYTINKLKNAKIFPDIPVILDSPLAIRITDIYKKYTHLFDEGFQNQLKTDSDLFDFPKLEISKSSQDSRKLNDMHKAMIIIAGSGMADAGRIPHHILHHIDQVHTQLMFTGFQVPGTLGRKITDGAKNIKIGKYYINIRGKVGNINAFSAHADQAGVIRWLSGFKTKPKVFLTHGEDEPRRVLAAKIQEELKVSSYIPTLSETVTL